MSSPSPTHIVSCAYFCLLILVELSKQNMRNTFDSEQLTAYTLSTMCFEVECKKCGKLTWAGCGKHIDKVMSNIEEEFRCTCDKSDEKKTSKVNENAKDTAESDQVSTEQ
ncbi:hypothetical protein GJ496_010191 [Pomphorhynchus laevis]|nr:hypothetical protein GJ496_010191 [Pomphorhynchus laevis]